MKRINPNTNQIFKRGDVREDGLIFKAYAMKRVRKNGYFVELWASPDVFARSSKDGNKTVRARYCTSKGRAGYMLRAAKSRANKNNAVCSLSIDWIEQKINQGFCELTGLPFDLDYAADTSKNPYAPSLDRIDSKNKNYTPENTRVVLLAVNCALSEFGLETIRPILTAMLSLVK
jgi:hypothetical protein